jgi:pimeloyl-ACP methyl ester carboxylesterase
MRVSVREGELEVDEHGPAEGPVVVLLHGFPQTPYCWRLVAPALAAAGLRVLVPALRGAAPGVRPGDDSAYALPRTVEDLLAVLDAAGVPAAHVVGHDWGGLVAWTAAAHAPDRVRGVVVLSTPHPRVLAEAVRADPDQQERSSYVERLAAPEAAAALLADDAAVLRAVLSGCGAGEHYVQELSAPGALHAFLGLYRALSWDELAQVGDVAVPAVFVHGEGDEVFGAGAVQRTVELLGPTGREVHLPRGGHWLPEQQPDDVVREVLALVGAAERPQGEPGREEQQQESARTGR